MKLSIVIGSANDPLLNSTVRSIRETAGDEPEVVVVDDCSANRVSCPEANLVIHNRYRCGCAASRHIGALHASGDFILIIDAHMRFPDGWYRKAMEHLLIYPAAINCATCLGLSKDNMDLEHPDAVYSGATLNVYGRDRNDRKKMQVMEVIWRDGEGGNGMVLPAVMGAAYFVPRDWFLNEAPLEHLRGWGGDELAISLAAWMSGRYIRLMGNVAIGHRFKSPTERPYSVPIGYPTYNKLFIIETMAPEYSHAISKAVQQTVPGVEWEAAQKLIRSEWSTIAIRAHRNGTLWTSFSDYCKKFNFDLSPFSLS